MKKIDSVVLEELRTLCYDELNFQPIDHKTRYEAVVIISQFLNNNGYKINKVKCDEENNPDSYVDAGRILIHIYEASMWSKEEFIHTIIL